MKKNLLTAVTFVIMCITVGAQVVTDIEETVNGTNKAGDLTINGYGDEDLWTEDATSIEIMNLFSEASLNPDYTEEELNKIIDAFCVFQKAVKRGLPNQLFEMLYRAMDAEFGRKAYAAYILWCTYEDDGAWAKEAIQSFANDVKAEIGRRAGWSTEQHNKEYRLELE